MNPNRNDNRRPQRRREWGGRQGAVSTLTYQQGNRQQGHHPSNASNSAQRNYERYLALAREATVKGDTIEMENCYQHAEHYFRIMGAGRLTED
jgi:hypothetical protein